MASTTRSPDAPCGTISRRAQEQRWPVVTKAAKLRLLGGALVGKVGAVLRPAGKTVEPAR